MNAKTTFGTLVMVIGGVYEIGYLAYQRSAQPQGNLTWDAFNYAAAVICVAGFIIGLWGMCSE